ncbi:MAG: TolC family protein [Arenibacterium sp.]
MRITKLCGAFCALVLLVPAIGQTQSLKKAVQDALASNPELLSASAEARASAFELQQLESGFQPTVSLNANAGAERVDDPSSLSAADNDTTKFRREISLDAELVLFDGYRRANLVYSNAARVDGSIYVLLDAAETMALNATEVYVDTYRHLQLQDVARRTLARHREIGLQVDNLVESGRLPLSDKLQVQDRIRAAQLALIEVRQAGRDADARFERIVGYRRNGPLSIPGVRGLPHNVTELIKSSVDNSYRVRVANLEINRAKFDQKVAEADRMPRLSLNAGASQGFNIDGASGSQSDAFIGLRMTWTLYQGGRKAQTNALVERRSKAISERNVAIREVRELAERTWNSYLANNERVNVLRAQLGENRELVEQFESEFQAGTRTLLELLEVERAMFDVEFETVSAQASLAFSAYRLLATQSKLAQYFGATAAGHTLAPDFSERALVKPTSVFRTQIQPLSR